MTHGEQYERLVQLCEQYDPKDHDSGTYFAIEALKREIGTMEATLIVDAFKARQQYQHMKAQLRRLSEG